MEEGIVELDDVLVAELMEDVDLNGKIGELLQIYGIKHRKNCEGCPMSLLIVRKQRLS